MNALNLPGFTAEASIYRTKDYRNMQVAGMSNGLGVVPALIFSTPWCDCYCHGNGNCKCICYSDPIFWFK
jgi:hypothetical protein